MKKREFNKILKQISTKNLIDISKISNLDKSILDDMVYFIVRNRGPVLVNLITESMDMSWLSSCGYLYRTKSKVNNNFEFIHTGEHNIL